MITYFPPIYENETMYSIACRIARKCNLSYSAMIQEVFGAARGQVIHPIIGFNLGYLFSELPDEYPISMQDMIDQHTIFPAYKISVPLEEYLEIIEDIGKSKKYVGEKIIRSNKNNRGYQLKYCDCCIKEDKDRYGEAYFHREHQYGGNIVCHKHVKPLKVIVMKNGGKELININNITGRNNKEGAYRVSDKDLEGAYNIALKIEFLLQHHEFLNSGYIKQLCINALINDGILTGNAINTKEIGNRIVNKYGYRLLDTIKCLDVERIKHFYDINEVVVDPIKNIIFIESIIGNEFEMILNNNNGKKLLQGTMEKASTKQEEYNIYSKEESLISKIRSLYRYRISLLKNKSVTNIKKEIIDKLTEEYLWIYEDDKEWVSRCLTEAICSDNDLLFNVTQIEYRKIFLREVEKSGRMNGITMQNKIGYKYVWLTLYDSKWLEEQMHK